MLLTPHRSAESLIFADHQGLTFGDFVKAGEQLGMRDAVLAYMDEAAKSRKTISEFCEEIASSFEKNPGATKAAMDVVSHGNFLVPYTPDITGMVFTFEPDVSIKRPSMSITAYMDTSRDINDERPRYSAPGTEDVFRSIIRFESSDSKKIDQITELMEVSSWAGYLRSKTTGTAKLDEHNHIFDLAERYYDADDMLHPSTHREIVFGNGDRLTLDQDSCLRPIEVYDQSGHIGSLDNRRFDPASISYEEIKAALNGHSDIDADEYGLLTDVGGRVAYSDPHYANDIAACCDYESPIMRDSDAPPSTRFDFNDFEIGD